MKFSNPFKTGTLWISQTYHQNTSNKAVDFGSVSVGKSVYAIADGTITTVSSASGSYCVLTVKDSPIRIFYVHCYKFVKKGSVVKKGDKIAEIAPTSVTGYPVHLHLGLNLGYNLMDYMDRNIVFATKYADIMKSWFTSSEKINWALFKDLSYITNKPEAPAMPPEQTECEKRVVRLEGELKESKAITESLGGQLERLMAEFNTLNESAIESKKEFDNLQKKYDILHIEKNRIENDLVKTVAQLNSQLSTISVGKIFSELFKRLFAKLTKLLKG